jgi:hypothetical protein
MRSRSGRCMLRQRSGPVSCSGMPPRAQPAAPRQAALRRGRSKSRMSSRFGRRPARCIGLYRLSMFVQRSKLYIATLQPPLQSAAMSAMRLAARGGSNEPQVSSEREVIKRTGRTALSNPVDSISGFENVPAATPGAQGKWRSSKLATWSNSLAV